MVVSLGVPIFRVFTVPPLCLKYIHLKVAIPYFAFHFNKRDNNGIVQWNLYEWSPLNNSNLIITASCQYLQSSVLLYMYI